jgi:hypothetical protein
MIEKLAILDDVESDDVASCLIVAAIDHNEDILLLLFEPAIQGVNLAQEEADVFFLIFSYEIICNLVFE